MSIELKVFGGAYFPKDKALKKHPNLKPLATAVNASTKAIAEAIIFGKLAAEQPEHIDDYFKVKIWEHREGLPCPVLDVFSPEFFDRVAVWNVNAGEPAAAPQSETDEKADWEDNKAQEEIKTVARLDQASRAACLALFGPVPGITTAQYGQIVDLLNDDESSYARELAEALWKETRALALAPERQKQLLAWLRENTKESAQWPDIKKQIAKWIDTPVDKRPQAANIAKEEVVVIRTDQAHACAPARLQTVISSTAKIVWVTRLPWVLKRASKNSTFTPCHPPFTNRPKLFACQVLMRSTRPGIAWLSLRPVEWTFRER